MVSRRRTDALRVDVGVQACLSGASFHHHFWKREHRESNLFKSEGRGLAWQDLDGIAARNEPKDFRTCGDRSGWLCVTSS
jgi:hypothetical protein